MGMGTNIIVFLILFAFGLSVYNCATPAYPSASCPFTASFDNLLKAFEQNLFTYTNTTYAVGSILGLAAIIGTFVFPNPYSIFLGVSLLVLSLALPGGAMYTILASQAGIPDAVMNLISGVFCSVFIIAILAWYAGRDVF
jgi:hypothetical protein